MLAGGIEKTEYLDQAEVDSCDRDLRRLIPTGLVNGLFPRRPAGVDVGGRWRPDYEKYFEVGLNLPLVRLKGDDPAAWMRRVYKKQKGINSLEHLREILELLERLLHAGAHPWHRREDLHHAVWEVVLTEADSSLTRNTPRYPDDHHPVKESQECVRWVTTRLASPEGDRLRTVSSRLRAIPFHEWRQQSVLGVYEYRVGHGALQRKIYRSHRHDRLTDVLCADLLYLQGPRAAWWGSPGTRRRVRAIGQLISVFKRLAEARLHGDQSKAIEDWSEDIEWIESEWGVSIRNEGF